MKYKKSLSLLLLIGLCGVLIWYFNKGYNYRISFKTPQSPGAVYSTLVNWGTLSTFAVDSAKITSKQPFEEIKQKFYMNDSVFDYMWEIEPINDSLTKVVAYVNDEANSFDQNLIVPFKKNDFVNRSIKEVKLIRDFITQLHENFKVEIVEDSIFDVSTKYCAYMPLESKINQKAGTMATNIGYIMGYIRANDIELAGEPYLWVKELDLANDYIKFDFCFPIQRKDSLPQSQLVKFKDPQDFKAIKAIFNGNYRSTDFAWFELMRYAKKQGISIKEQPLEIFYDDPQSGTDSKDWTAEVFL
ncbi:MAG: hypothetical protein R3213_11485, partial [Flavobacteriaceae bacterium]|nr:hypothetical protein [Flavobacteriaceae bacterium]